MIVSLDSNGKLQVYVRTNLVTPLLETRDDVTNESSLDTVGLKNKSFERHGVSRLSCESYK